MDEELKGTNVVTRNKHDSIADNQSDLINQDLDALQMDESALTDILESLALEAETRNMIGESAPGPASNMLREMGIDIPSSLLYKDKI